MTRNVLAVTLFFLLAGISVWYLNRRSPESRPAPQEVPLSENDQTFAPETRVAVTYLCNEGKTIEAVYFEEHHPNDPNERARRVRAPGAAGLQPSRETTPRPSGSGSETSIGTSGSSDAAASSAQEVQPDSIGKIPPVPHGRVHLLLSDGREMTLAQTISASGIRYSDGNPSVARSESCVFWSKGNSALVLEHNVEKSYIGCIAIVPDPGGLSGTFANSSEGYSIRYPSAWEIEPDYTSELRPGVSIHGVKFRVPDSLAAGSNLSADSGISVETIYVPNLARSGFSDSCSARAFLSAPRTVEEATEDGVEYSIATSIEAAAGNRYEEIVYVVKGTEPCLAVRYFIHYGAIGNYEPGAVEEFNRDSLLERLDTIRCTLTNAP